VGGFIFWQRPNEWMALLVSLWLITFGTNILSGKALAELPTYWLWAQAFVDYLGWVVLLPLFLFTFPNGRFVPHWSSWLYLAYIGIGFAGFLIELSGAYLNATNSMATQLIWLTVQLMGVLAQIYRYWRVSTLVHRQQTKWLVFGLVATVLILSSYTSFNLPELMAKVSEMAVVSIAFLVIPFTFAISILRFRLWDIDLVIHHTLLYGALTATVAGGYIFVVTMLSAVMSTESNFMASLLATGIIAAVFAPLRDWIQRGVNRLIYGERDAPYVVLSRLGRLLAGTAVPATTLHTLVETVAKALKLPYAAIELKDNDTYWPRDEYGTAVPDEIAFPLLHQKEVVGQLVVAPRAPGEPLSPREKQLLEDIAFQAGAVAYTVRLTVALQRARQRLVTAREEERRRLRRDLHDGLGPTLASHTLRLDTAIDLVHSDPEAAMVQLQALYGQTQEIIVEIRRLVYQLRPSVLDDLGLVSAVELHIQHSRLGQNRPCIVVEAPPDGLHLVSAAVELGAYRITLEALTNVIRHAHAEHCRIKFCLVKRRYHRALSIVISDDGQGLPTPLHVGVGLTSMRERAEELGGFLRVEVAEGGGTAVYAELPLPEEKMI
jgi:signal transduction histidine kinase